MLGTQLMDFLLFQSNYLSLLINVSACLRLVGHFHWLVHSSLNPELKTQAKKAVWLVHDSVSVGWQSHPELETQAKKPVAGLHIPHPGSGEQDLAALAPAPLDAGLQLNLLIRFSVEPSRGPSQLQ